MKHVFLIYFREFYHYRSFIIHFTVSPSDFSSSSSRHWGDRPGIILSQPRWTNGLFGGFDEESLYQWGWETITGEQSLDWRPLWGNQPAPDVIYGRRSYGDNVSANLTFAFLHSLRYHMLSFCWSWSRSQKTWFFSCQGVHRQSGDLVCYHGPICELAWGKAYS